MHPSDKLFLWRSKFTVLLQSVELAWLTLILKKLALDSASPSSLIFLHHFLIEKNGSFSSYSSSWSLFSPNGIFNFILSASFRFQGFHCADFPPTRSSSNSSIVAVVVVVVVVPRCKDCRRHMCKTCRCSWRRTMATSTRLLKCYPDRKVLSPSTSWPLVLGAELFVFPILVAVAAAAVEVCAAAFSAVGFWPMRWRTIFLSPSKAFFQNWWVPSWTSWW